MAFAENVWINRTWHEVNLSVGGVWLHYQAGWSFVHLTPREVKKVSQFAVCFVGLKVEGIRSQSAEIIEPWEPL